MFRTQNTPERRRGCPGWVTQNRILLAWVLCHLTCGAMLQEASAEPLDETTGEVAGACPGPDSDGDGVGDACDNCPNTPAETLTFAQTVNAPIPDPASLTTCGTVTTSLSRTITVNDPGITVGVRVSMNLLHSTYSDVDIKLAHAGTVITLNPVSSTSQIRNTSDLDGTYRFDDAAGVPLEYEANNCFIFECGIVVPGTYHGSGFLDAFTGTPAVGDWTLIVSDGCRINTGTLRSWSLELDIAYPDQFDYDSDGVGDVCDNCPNSSGLPAESLDAVFAPIPDGEQGTCYFPTTQLTRTVTLSEAGSVASLELALELDHTFYEDLDVQLEHNGTVVTLMSDDRAYPVLHIDLNGAYTFTDSAAQALDEAAENCLFSGCSLVPPGTYRGEEPLSAFHGMDAHGDWTLTIRDICFMDIGFLHSWTLSLLVQDASQTDTDGDGMGDACDLCASGARSGDTEADGDFDLVDYEMMAVCLQEVAGLLSPGCDCFDFDEDGDVDLKDAGQMALDYQPQPGCLINGVFYQPGQSDAPPFACRSCQPHVSRKQWTMTPSDTVCRPAAGGCDIAEVCSGSSTDCPPNARQPALHECRPAAGACDRPEFCSGFSSACPTDMVELPSFSPCRPSAGGCDVAEFCTGTSASCPQDQLRPDNFECRPASGGCDVAEVCSGTSTACPQDLIRPNNYECRAPAGGCDLAETCNGASVACPQDLVRPFNYVCRSAVGGCDVAETCNGASALCPQDVLRPVNFWCRPSVGICDVTEVCNGTSGTCPADAKQLSSFVCAPETGPNGEYLCHDTVRCNGTSDTCPFPTIISYDATRICRASTAQCDPPEYCVNGGGACAPDVSWTAGQVCPGAGACEFDYTCNAAGACNSSGFRSGTASCRAPANGCDERDYCERDRTDFTDYPACGPDRKKPDGTTCAVGALAGTCASGECITITNCRYDIDCPDGYLCNSGDCVAAPVDHGFGDECVGKRICDLSSVHPGAFCAFSTDCRDATHPNGNCINGVRGDCASGLVCCGGMAGDGVGAAAAPGQKGRCQECCATDYWDATVTGCGDLECCDGKCTDILNDSHNCGGCAYNGGVDCKNLIDACSPAVEGCVKGARGGECIMTSACYDPSEPISMYDQCSMSAVIQVPNPTCNYCDPLLTPDEKDYAGCWNDSDCGPLVGSCHRVPGRCTPDSANPHLECTPGDPVLGDILCRDDAHPNGTCWDSCYSLFAYAAGGPPRLYIPVGDCSAPPYEGCTVTCETPTFDWEVPNVGAECDDDDDCLGGTTCQSSCNIGVSDGPFSFCFSPNTCQW